MNWREISGDYPALAPEVSGELKALLGTLRDSGLDAISRPLDHAVAVASKPECTTFMLHAIGHALKDHTLSSEEVQELRTLQRILRIEEGDLLEHQRSRLADLLCREAELR